MNSLKLLVLLPESTFVYNTSTNIKFSCHRFWDVIFVFSGSIVRLEVNNAIVPNYTTRQNVKRKKVNAVNVIVM